MDINELKENRHVTVTKVQDGCYKVTPEVGYALKFGDSAFSDELYLGKEFDTVVSVVEYGKKMFEEHKAKYDGCTLTSVKKGVLEEIARYDDSSAVNEFSIGGKKVWIPKDTRLGLRNNVSDTEAIGGTEVTFWFAGFGSLTVKTDAAKQMLVALENYAFACYNVTAEHKANVEALTSVEDVLGYDYTKGYPDKLNFDI